MNMSLQREPTTPGEILSEEFLKPLGMTQRQLAEHIRCDVKVINRLINARTAVTAEMAIKLSRALGTTPEFWLNAQQAVNLYKAEKTISYQPEPLRRTG
jgi:antitoxin HigA-1